MFKSSHTLISLFVITSSLTLQIVTIFSVPLCQSFSTSSFLSSRGSHLLNHGFSRSCSTSRTVVSFRNRHSSESKSSSFLLGLRPFRKKVNSTKNKTASKGNATISSSEIKTKNETETSTKNHSQSLKDERNLNSTIITQNNATLIDSSRNVTSSETNSTEPPPTPQKKKGGSNLLAETISQSFHFFDDKQNLPKYKAPKRKVTNNLKDDTQDLTSSISSNFRFLDGQDKSSTGKPSKTSAGIMTNEANITSQIAVDPNTPLTFADLQLILTQNGYVRREEISSIVNNPMKQEQNVTLNTKKTASGVALPQPSVVSNKHIKIGSMISSGFFGLLLAATIQPNLWLLGAVAGGLYGGDLAEKAAIIATLPPQMPSVSSDGALIPAPINRIPGGLYGELTLKCGRQIATAYLKVYDLFMGFWFLYRTGQLSYEYYKTYAVLDKRFGVQSKMDAWNARFIEGKENFDQWEKENEVGRKVLAGLRTVWMVEESSFKKQMKKGKKKKASKYRIVQVFFDTADWCKRALHAVWVAIRGGRSDELNEIINGIKMNMNQLNLETVSQRVGASLAALVLVNFLGACFAVAPYLLGFIAIASGIIFPNWIANSVNLLKDVIKDTRARGRGEQAVISIAKKSNKVGNEKLPFVSKDKFSFYVKDGQKKWYRTGQSYRGWSNNNEVDENGFKFVFPWEGRM